MPRRYRGEPRTRFAELLTNYMWSQRPPLDQKALAQLIDVSTNAVHGWLARGVLPRNVHEIVPKIAIATGIPQGALYDALGMRLPGSEATLPPAGPVRIVEVDRFGELIADLHHQARFTPAQKWLAVESAWLRATGQDRPAEWIEAEHDVAVAPTEPNLPAIPPSPLDRPRINADTNPVQPTPDEPARTGGAAK